MSGQSTSREFKDDYQSTNSAPREAISNATFDHDSEKSMTADESPLLRESSLYRSKSEYESTTEKQHFDSYKDFMTHQNSMELSLNFKDTVAAPL